MSIQPGRELGTLYVIQEMFRDESPNVGSFVKVNFEQKEIKIADEYAKVIIGQKQPIQANFEPSYFVCLSCFCFRWFVLERTQLYRNSRRLY